MGSVKSAAFADMGRIVYINPVTGEVTEQGSTQYTDVEAGLVTMVGDVPYVLSPSDVQVLSGNKSYRGAVTDVSSSGVDPLTATVGTRYIVGATPASFFSAFTAGHIVELRADIGGTPAWVAEPAPTVGALAFDADSGTAPVLRYFDGTAWVAIDAAAKSFALSGDVTTLSSANSYADTLVSNVQQGLFPRASVAAVALADVDLSATTQLTADGYAVLHGESVLLANQTDAKQNGVYVATDASGTWSYARRADMDGTPAYEVKRGVVVFVEKGATRFNEQWVITGNDTVTVDGNINVGTEDMIWSQLTKVSELIPQKSLFIDPTSGVQNLEIREGKGIVEVDYSGTWKLEAKVDGVSLKKNAGAGTDELAVDFATPGSYASSGKAVKAGDQILSTGAINVGFDGTGLEYATSATTVQAAIAALDVQLETVSGTFNLQTAYVNDVNGSGATITTDATDGDVIIAGSEAFRVTAADGIVNERAYIGGAYDAPNTWLTSTLGDGEIRTAGAADFQAKEFYVHSATNGAGFYEFEQASADSSKYAQLNVNRNATDVFEANLTVQHGGGVGKVRLLQNTTDATLTDLELDASGNISIGASGGLVKINTVPYQFPATQGADGTVLVDNGSGTLAWASPLATVGYTAQATMVAGDLIAVGTGDMTAKKLAVTTDEVSIGVAAYAATSGAAVKAAVPGMVISIADVSGATLGKRLFWSGTALTTSMSSIGSGSRVWEVGTIVAATAGAMKMRVEARFIKRNA